MISGFGRLAFPTPYGIRPLVFGTNMAAEGQEYVVASESVALAAMGFELVRDVAPGEAILVSEKGEFFSRQCAAKTMLSPCIFECVSRARPDSVIAGVSVYATRLNMAPGLADKTSRPMHRLEIDVVVPVPD